MKVLAIVIFGLLLRNIYLNRIFQNNYTVKHVEAEIIHYNKQLLENPKLILFFYNRTTKAFNISMTLRKNLGVHVQVNVTVYKFINNQYRFYPVDMQYKNPCSILEHNLFGAQDVVQHLNITKCPVLPGHYEINNVIPDVSKFPPYLIPDGNYRICGSLYKSYVNVHVITVCWQGEVKSVGLF